MARHEADREDLMHEAAALKRRIEICLPGEIEPIVAGFRSDGMLSLYFGQDPMYQFDPGGRLRRAYIAGFLYRTQGTTLARLHRVRTPTATELPRHDLDAPALDSLLAIMHDRIRRLLTALEVADARIVQQVPGSDDRLPADLVQGLRSIIAAEQPLAPPIPGKR